MNLITGATGLLGAHVAFMLLQQGKPVVAMKRRSSDIQKTRKLFAYYTPEADRLFEQIQWVEGDVCDIYTVLEALENIDTVYHCAGYISFTSKDREQLHKINAEGTANVVNACLEKNIRHLIHVSSIATLQNPDIKTNINESVYWKSSPDAADYAISKYNGEREVWRGIEEGLQATIVNPGVIIGPGFWKQGSGQLITELSKGLPVYTSGSTAYIDARNVAEIMLKLAEQQQFGQRFILIEGNYTFKDIFSSISKALGKREPSIQAGYGLLWVGRILDKLKSGITGSARVVTRETIHACMDVNTYDNSKITKLLNYRFIPTQESLAFSCACFLRDTATES